MFAINRRLASGEYKKVYAFTVDEAEDRGIEYEYWRDIAWAFAGTHVPVEDNKRKPKWMLVDDGFVIQYLRLKNVFKFKLIEFKTYWGNFLTSYEMYRKKHLEGQPANRIYMTRFYLLPQNKEGVNLYENKNTTYMTEEYKKTIAAMFARGLVANEVVELFRMNTAMGKATTKWRKTEECRAMIRDELKKILDDNGITEDFVAKELVNVLNDSKKGKSIKVQLDVVREMMDLLAMKENRVKTSEMLELSENRKIDEVKRQLKYEKVSVKDENLIEIEKLKRKGDEDENIERTHS